MSEEVKDGGPAFPGGELPEHPKHPNGMSLRDYVAAQCLAAATASPELMEVVSSGSILDGSAFDRMAKRAFQQADAFLTARQKDTAP